MSHREYLEYSYRVKTKNISHLNQFEPPSPPLKSTTNRNNKTSFTVLIFSYRKAGTIPTAFKSHYGSRHVPLLQSLTGSHFPKSHKRYYIQRSEDAADTSNKNYPATVLVGTQPGFQCDAFAELTFDDAAKFQTFMGIVSQGEAKD